MISKPHKGGSMKGEAMREQTTGGGMKPHIEYFLNWNEWVIGLTWYKHKRNGFTLTFQIFPLSISLVWIWIQEVI
jgi:hypothetical protein